MLVCQTCGDWVVEPGLPGGTPCRRPECDGSLSPLRPEDLDLSDGSSSLWPFGITPELVEALRDLELVAYFCADCELRFYYHEAPDDPRCKTCGRAIERQ